MRNIFSKETAKNVAIKGTSIVLGTGYVLAKTFANGCKNLEASIVTKIDENYTKREVRKHRMRSYFEVHNTINRNANKVVAEYKLNVDNLERVARKLHARAKAHELTLMNMDSINATPQC